MAEGAQDRNLNKISSAAVKDLLSTRLHLDTRVTVLGHTQRGGPACAHDRWLSTLQGVEAVNALLDATPGCPSPVVIIRENKIGRASLMEAVRQTKEITELIKAKKFEEALSMRDSEFKEYHLAYLNTTTTDHPKMTLPESEV